jgi:beta-glucosidase
MYFRKLKTVFILTLIVGFSSSYKVDPPYKNAKLPIAVRVKDLLERMTLEEKVAQTQCIWSQKQKLYTNKDFDVKKASEILPHGIGQLARPNEGAGADNPYGTGLKGKEMAEWTNKIQKYFVENTRLGIPVMFHEESLHGNQSKDATVFPTPLAMANSWNEALMTEVYSHIAEEVRSRGGHEVLAPVLDITLDPRWGRSEETMGEDPYLVSRLGVTIVKAYQGDKEILDKKHVAATLKHFGVHGQPEGGSNVGPTFVDERTLRTVFFPPFKACVQEAKAMSLMPCYAEVRSEPVHGSKWLLTDMLRKEWGFKGVVVSDYGGVKDLETLHHVAENAEQTALRAFSAGVDVETPDTYGFTSLLSLVKSGKISMAMLDESVSRILTAKFRMGLFDDPYVDANYADQFTGNAEMRALALKAARQSMVLLKNEGSILPLDKSKVKKLAVIGPNANKCLLGGYADVPKQTVSPLQALKEKYGKDVEIMYAEGTRITESGNWFSDKNVLANREDNLKRIAEAVEIAKQADAVILMLGGNEALSKEAWASNHMGDLTTLDLMGNQDELVDAIKATGKPIAAFVFSGPPLSIAKLDKEIPAIVYGFYLGQESGYAVAETIFGDNNPTGKLSISIPRSVGHLPVYYYHKPSARRGYNLADISPLYSFGHGLSFTNFKYNNLKISQSSIKADGSATVTVDVTNTGKRAGDEIVQLYIHDLVSTLTRPVKELKDFARISLNAGETKTVSFKITGDKLKYLDENMKEIVEPGEFEIMVGGSSLKSDVVKLTVMK